MIDALLDELADAAQPAPGRTRLPTIPADQAPTHGCRHYVPVRWTLGRAGVAEVRACRDEPEPHPLGEYRPRGAVLTRRERRA